MEMHYIVWDRGGAYSDILVTVLTVTTTAPCPKPSGTSHTTGERKAIT